MKAIYTVTALSILFFCIIGCSPAEKEDPELTQEGDLEAVFNEERPEVTVDVSTHIRFENLTRFPIAVKLGATAKKIEPGSHEYLPEPVSDDRGAVDVTIACQKEEAWAVIYQSRWQISKRVIQNFFAYETTEGKIKFYGTREYSEQRTPSSESGRESTRPAEPRRRVILGKEPNKTMEEQPIQPPRD